MRTTFLALVLLAACNQAPAPSAAGDAAQPNAAPPIQGEAISTGPMGGFSEAATGVLSVLEVRGDSLHFLDDEGAPSVAAATSFLGARDGESAIAAGGQSFAAAASMPGSTRVELRRVEPPAPVALCWGEAPASHVALVYADPLTVMSVVVFSGPDAPGPNARDSVLCATYQYAVD